MYLTLKSIQKAQSDSFESGSELLILEYVSPGSKVKTHESEAYQLFFKGSTLSSSEPSFLINRRRDTRDGHDSFKNWS